VIGAAHVHGEGQMTGDKRRLRIAGDELLDAMTPIPEDPFTHYLHLDTGEIVALASPDHEAEIESDDEESKLLENPDRFEEIPRVDTSEEYDFMVRFAEAVDERDIREKLELALSGRGAFGRFRDVVSRYADLSSAWEAFRQRELVEIARRWLISIGVEAELTFRAPERPPDAPARPDTRKVVIGLRELLLLGAPDGKTELIDGQVTRMVRAPSPSEARHIFKSVARELYESEGIAWRNRFIEGRNSVDLHAYHLSVEGAVVTLEVEVDPQLWRKFSG
jgi:hypothetical protein